MRGDNLLPQPSEKWPDPEPLSVGNAPSRFPTGFLPTVLNHWAEAVAEELQVPNALPAMLALAACAIALQGKVRVGVTPNWSEPLNLYTVIAMEPAARKSPAFKHAMAPIEQWQREKAEAMSRDIAVALARHDALKQELERAKRKLAEADPADREAENQRLDELAQRVAESKPPAALRLVVDDCTPERLASVMAEQGGRIAIASDEGGGTFDIMAGRYSKDSAPNLDVYLKGYDGGTLRVDRIGRAPVLIENPTLTIAITTQPEVVRGLAGRPGFDGRGLLGRIMFVMPQNNVGSRKIDPPIIPAATRAAYHSLIRTLLVVPDAKAPDGRPTPHIIPFGAEALAERLDFAAWLEPQLTQHGKLGHIGRWAGKLEAMTVRIAGLLHMARNADATTPWLKRIDVETFLYARLIAEDFLIPHALAVFGEMGEDPQLAGARFIDAWMVDRQLETFTKRDAHHALQGRFPRARDLDAPLALLEERSRVIRLPEADQPRAAGGRPPSPAFAVNPALLPQERGCVVVYDHSGRMGSGDSASLVGNGSVPEAPHA